MKEEVTVKKRQGRKAEWKGRKKGQEEDGWRRKKWGKRRRRRRGKRKEEGDVAGSGSWHDAKNKCILRKLNSRLMRFWVNYSLIWSAAAGVTEVGRGGGDEGEGEREKAGKKKKRGREEGRWYGRRGGREEESEGGRKGREWKLEKNVVRNSEVGNREEKKLRWMGGNVRIVR